VLGREVLILELVGFLLGGAEDLLGAAGETDLGVALNAGEAGELAGEVLLHAGGVGAHGLEQGAGGAVGLLEERDGEVLGLDLGVRPVLGQRVGRLERFAGFLGQFVQLHTRPSGFAMCKCRARVPREAL
jgi:hypothetical protein